MLKWKTHKFSTINNNESPLFNMLSGAPDKTRSVKFVTCDIDSDIFLRVYRDSDQMVDLECDLITTSAPLLPVDIPLTSGQILNVGFYNEAAGVVTPSVAIGYEES